MAKCFLVTGGCGYIGSHCIVEMISAGYDVVIVDNLSNSDPECVRKVEEITGKSIPFYKDDLLNKEAVDKIFTKHKFLGVLHFAGFKAVGESVKIPLKYYHNNLTGTLHLLQCMQEHGVCNMVFSSSATVYGNPQFLPITEYHPVGGCTNPYGKTKYFIEEMLKDLCFAEKNWNVVSLRYFNPVGAHVSGKIGEDPKDIPNNLVPYITQVAVGKRPHLNVFGKDYDTPDGTGVRDYIHVVDLGLGHVAALKKLEENCGWKVYNLGTGKGYSVLDMVKALEKASGKEIPYKFAERRAGDVASVYADPALAEKELKWKAIREQDEMCADSWRWQMQNPDGYR
ncbi:UDP-glucose 4-epimerase-like isoform X2 [Actinia tenebrosa]|uniref:UDP-glucose 4-epimerase n=1 Tax=Actinia tenebrosa TaxID=6105 RepID=A0A6P8HFW1_ACTTE|nr:UDP-glucose 4-epimerase-like isoform X2 [Actinia tenebrosa]